MENNILRYKLAPYQNLIDLVDMFIRSDNIPDVVLADAVTKACANINMVCNLNEDECDDITGTEVKLQSVRKCGNCVHYNPLIENDIDGVPEACQLDLTLKPECNFTVCSKHKFGIRRG